MEKLRTTYLKYQSEILAPNPRFVSADKTNKIIRLADSELQKMRVSQNFTNYDEAAFYKEKFIKLSDIASKYESEKIPEQNYHKLARDTVKDSFLKKSNAIHDQNISFGSNANPGIRQKNKSPLKQFFDQQDIKNSKKVNLTSILGRDQTPLKYGLKSVSRSKTSSFVRPKNNQNDQQLRNLEAENRRLKQQLNQQKSSTLNDDERLRDLRNRVRELDDENRRLKSEVSRSSKTDIYIEEEYDPYNLKIRENNIVKIHNKNLYFNEKMSQFGGISEDFAKDKKTSQIYFDSQSDYIRPQYSPGLSPTRKDKNWDDDLLNSSQSSIQTQLLNLQNSELYDDTQNQVCRQKIAFFKRSMVISKGQDFDIAFKRSDFNTQMDKLRLILYINNKDLRRYNCMIDYDYDREDFDIIVRKKLQVVEGRSQGREQIEINLKNASDLGSLIMAKISVGDRMKKIVVPAMFIEFDNDFKYQFENIGYIERNLTQPLVIKPMSQFSNIERTSNVLELTRQYEQKYDMGRMYGKSKACKGVVKLTWKHGNKLKIQTCEQWRTLMGYLFLNAAETVNY